MDGGNSRIPNQWNPETENDNEIFDRAMRRLANVTDEEFEQRLMERLKPEPVPKEADRPTRLGLCFDNYLKEMERNNPCLFREFTPKDAREYVAWRKRNDT